MTEPFLEWLPDMDLAFNLDDECRVVVPFGEMQLLRKEAGAARKRIPLHGGVTSFTAHLEPSWSDDYLAGDFKETHGEDISPSFSTRDHHNSIFDTYIAPACGPSSPALTSRWWSRNTALPAGRGVVANATAAVDLCRRPDIARMHGFLLDPGSFGVTRTLFPHPQPEPHLGLRRRAGGPSPWNFMSKVDIDDAADVAWADKANSVFWRGSSSDGLSTHNSWAHVPACALRLACQARRALHGRRATAAAAAAAAPAAVARPRPWPPPSLPSTCPSSATSPSATARTCMAQTVAFFGAPEVADPPGGMDFQEHWAHRHLVDLDGAGFSGRFLPLHEEPQPHLPRVAVPHLVRRARPRMAALRAP